MRLIVLKFILLGHIASCHLENSTDSGSECCGVVGGMGLLTAFLGLSVWVEVCLPPLWGPFFPPASQVLDFAWTSLSLSVVSEVHGLSDNLPRGHLLSE